MAEKSTDETLEKPYTAAPLHSTLKSIMQDADMDDTLHDMLRPPRSSLIQLSASVEVES